MQSSLKQELVNGMYCNLFESETNSDIELHVGPDEQCQERIPAHSWVLINGSDYFRTLLDGPMSDPTIQVYKFPDDPNGFNNLIRWIYQGKCVVKSLQSQLITLEVGIKYLCPELADYCIKQITNDLNTDNVLIVIEWIRNYTSPESVPVSPSAPSEDTLTEDIIPEYRSNDPTVSCLDLLNKCLKLIDGQGEKVLASEALLSCSKEVLTSILKRDSLKVNSEMAVVHALYNWSKSMCRKQKLLMDLESRRKVLGDLIFLARYLILKPAEVKDEENRDILTKILLLDELRFVSAHCTKSESVTPPYTMIDVTKYMSRPRLINLINKTEKIKPHVKGFAKFKRRFSKKNFALHLCTVLALIFD